MQSPLLHEVDHSRGGVTGTQRIIPEDRANAETEHPDVADPQVIPPDRFLRGGAGVPNKQHAAQRSKQIKARQTRGSPYRVNDQVERLTAEGVRKPVRGEHFVVPD